MKPCILLQTDFSLTWSAVASMKGVIKIVDPSLDVQDICHEIKSFDPWEASMSLNTVEPYWPKGSIFVSVVDPGVGTKRKACVALLADGNYVVTPDNGTLTHLFHRVGVKEIREIDEKVNRYKAQEEVSVFHGRDIFAYCAARLASGLITFEQVGEKYPVEEVVICEEYEKKPVLGQCSASGFIQSGLKHFGGIQVNITNEEWKQCGFQLGDMVHTVIMHNGEWYLRRISYIMKPLAVWKNRSRFCTAAHPGICALTAIWIISWASMELSPEKSGRLLLQRCSVNAASRRIRASE